MAALAELNRAPPYRPAPTSLAGSAKGTAAVQSNTAARADIAADEDDWDALEAMAQEEAAFPDEDVDMDVLREIEEQEAAGRTSGERPEEAATGHASVRLEEGSERPRRSRIIFEEEDDFGAFGAEAENVPVPPARHDTEGTSCL